MAKRTDYNFPDISHPDRDFTGGDYVYSVNIFPALSPLIVPRSASSNPLADLIWQVVSEGIMALFDDRFKVVVWRMKRRPPRFHFPVIWVQFVDTWDDAVKVRDEIIANWKFPVYEALPPVGASERGRLRRATRRGNR